MRSGPRLALDLFAPIAPTYQRWAAILSLGQDRRWREAMVTGIHLAPGELVLDVAAGTGSISRLLVGRGCRVIAVDQSPQMLSQLTGEGIDPVRAGAERLPFPDGTFEAVTFGYLLRYVDDLPAAIGELSRVLRRGGTMAALEFGRPEGVWRAPWRLYTRFVLGLAGRMVGGGWAEVGSFLGPSIDQLWDRYPPQSLAGIWREAGLDQVRWRHMSFGGGFLIWGVRG